MKVAEASTIAIGARRAKPAARFARAASTGDLDEARIIGQEAARVDDAMRVEEQVAPGRGAECFARTRAVKFRLARRAFPDGAKTVVFR